MGRRDAGRFLGMKYTDDTPIPWGEHEGTPLKDVPLAYLEDLFHKGWISGYPDLYRYLLSIKHRFEENKKEQEIKEGFDSYEDYERWR